MLSLVRQENTAPVWLSDLLTRRWVQTEAELAVVRANLKARGLPTNVTVVSSLAAYGVPVGKVPA
jgi:hypothetical protein